MTKKILFYKTTEPYGEFSNFSRHPIELDGKTWATTEHYFQAQKFNGTDPEWMEKIRLARSPREAADMGRDRDKPLRPDWENVKEDVMLTALKAKFSQYDGLKALLLETNDAELVEHTRNDSYWADGGDGSGKNRLGVLLMVIRDIIRAQEYTKNAPTSKSLCSSFFGPITDLVLSDGGDGMAVIISRYVPAKLVGDWYMEWQSARKCKLERQDRDDGSVSFWDDQEGIVIVNGPHDGLSESKLNEIKEHYRFGNYIVII